MLRSLHIENIALIKMLDIDFDTGFSVFTGETGAGKSILIDSISFLCGSRSNKDIIRTGESGAFVSAYFEDISREAENVMSEFSLSSEVSDNALMVSRTLSIDGKSVCKIGRRTVPVSVLKAVLSQLISISEQHDSYALLNSDRHIDYLDKFTKSTNTEFSLIKSEYEASYSAYVSAKSKLEEAFIDEQDRKTKLEFLHYQAREIESANLKPGEEESLIFEKEIIQNSEMITKAVKGACLLLMGSTKPGVYDRLVMSAENVELISNVVPEGAEIVSKLTSLSEQVKDINDTLLRLVPKNVDDPSAVLDRIESRLDTISKIKAKYGASEEEVIEKHKKILEEISFFEEYEFSIKELQESCDRAYKECLEKAKTLRLAREKSSRELSHKVNGEFEFLDMTGVEFSTDFKALEELSESGDSQIEFLIKTNVGEPFKKLSSIASGGELSRIMLALMKTLAGGDNVGTIVFDEIDTGVSGKTSSKIGISIKDISNERQVICVTHSAQVSAVSDHHFKIFKKEMDGRAFTNVEKLSDDARVQEIARILGGVTITDSVMASARELITQGKNI